MKRRLIIGVAVALALCVAIGVGFAQEGGDGQRREKPDAAERAKRQEQGMLMSAMQTLRAAAELPEAEAARTAYLAEVKPVMEEMRNMHREQMKAARKDGATEEEIKALRQKAQAAVAEAHKKWIPAQIAYCKALLAIAEQHPDKVAAQSAKDQAKNMRRGRGREQGQGPPRGGNRQPKHDQPAEVE